MASPKNDLINYVEFLRESGNLYVESGAESMTEARAHAMQLRPMPGSAPPKPAAAKTGARKTAAPAESEPADQSDLFSAAAPAAPPLRENPLG